MTLLEGQNLTKTFGGIVAIDDVSFSIEEGEAVGLIGPNGAGKTTLFRTITGVHTPTEGQVFFKGEDITGKTQHEICHRGLAKTHQIVRPFESLTLLENVTVGASFGGREFEDVKERAREMLRFVGLADEMYDTPTELSVGALKRLEIARVLATDPDIVLFDEVAGGLDPEETEEIIDLVDEIKAGGTTVFLIDHVMRALMSVSERVLVLNNGRLIAEGSPEAIQNDDEVIEAYLGEKDDANLSNAVTGD